MSAGGEQVFVVGVGMVPFCKPGDSDPYDVLAANATASALKDAGIDFTDVQQAYVGYVYGDSTAGQKALYKIGMTGIPIFNINNNCSTGSSALYLARQAVESGAADCVLALGFEQMNPGALGTVFNDRPTPFEDFDKECEDLVGMSDIPLALRYFGGAGLEHMNKHGTSLEAFARIRAKASTHAVNNPLALFRNTAKYRVSFRRRRHDEQAHLDPADPAHPGLLGVPLNKPPFLKHLRYGIHWQYCIDTL